MPRLNNFQATYNLHQFALDATLSTFVKQLTTWPWCHVSSCLKQCTYVTCIFSSLALCVALLSSRWPPSTKDESGFVSMSELVQGPQIRISECRSEGAPLFTIPQFPTDNWFIDGCENGVPMGTLNGFCSKCKSQWWNIVRKIRQFPGVTIKA